MIAIRYVIEFRATESAMLTFDAFLRTAPQERKWRESIRLDLFGYILNPRENNSYYSMVKA